MQQIKLAVLDKQCRRKQMTISFIGPADCNHYNCNHMLFSESSKFQSTSTQGLKQFVVTVAAVTVCWSYESYAHRIFGAPGPCPFPSPRSYVTINENTREPMP